MNKIASRINVCADNWTTELSTIASNGNRFWQIEYNLIVHYLKLSAHMQLSYTSCIYMVLRYCLHTAPIWGGSRISPGGGANPQAGGCQHIIITNVSEKLHEIEKKLIRRADARRESPLGSATAHARY